MGTRPNGYWANSLAEGLFSSGFLSRISRLKISSFVLVLFPQKGGKKNQASLSLSFALALVTQKESAASA